MRTHAIALLTLSLCSAGTLSAGGRRGLLFLRHLRYLASDELKGRGNTEPELGLAADYIAQRFQEYGLLPVGRDGTYFQDFSITIGHRLGRKGVLALFEDPSQPVQLELGEDWVPLTYDSRGKMTGGLVFAGFGISAPDYHYDDYKGLDVGGKVVVIYEHEPLEQSERSPFDGREWTPYSTVMSKVLTAKHRGAAGVILLPDEFNHDRPIRLNHSDAEPIEDMGIFTIRLSEAWGRRLMDLSGHDLRVVWRWINGQVTPYSFPFENVKLAISLDVAKVRVPLQNVVGLLPGQSDEFVVVGAHYDHLGLGGKASVSQDHIGEIHNGADDNASGTAGLLQLAREFSGTRPRRGLLFVAFAGEELGLLGSRHYTSSPIVPLQQTVAMVNMDMIGRSQGDLLITGVGTATAFRPLLEELDEASPLHFRLAETPGGSSDHLPFTLKGIPVLFFTSGLHSDYHRSSDDWEKIDVVRAEQVVAVVRALLQRLDNFPSPIEGVDLGEAERSREADRGYGPLFGVIPDMTYDAGGVRFDQVLEQTPADKAGLQQGDILIRLEGQRIDTLYDFTYVLRSTKAGDVVAVVVLRRDKPLTARVRLQARR
ncbi:MAG: M28 family peptidase [Acidobacteriota bacterium]